MIINVNLLLHHGFYLFQGEGLIWINHQELDHKRLNVHHCANRQITSRFTASRYFWWIHNIQWPFFEFLKKITDSASHWMGRDRSNSWELTASSKSWALRGPGSSNWTVRSWRKRRDISWNLHHWCYFRDIIHTYTITHIYHNII